MQERESPNSRESHENEVSSRFASSSASGQGQMPDDSIPDAVCTKVIETAFQLVKQGRLAEAEYALGSLTAQGYSMAAERLNELRDLRSQNVQALREGRPRIWVLISAFVLLLLGSCTILGGIAGNLVSDFAVLLLDLSVPLSLPVIVGGASVAAVGAFVLGYYLLRCASVAIAIRRTTRPYRVTPFWRRECRCCGLIVQRPAVTCPFCGVSKTTNSTAQLVRVLMMNRVRLACLVGIVSLALALVVGTLWGISRVSGWTATPALPAQAGGARSGLGGGATPPKLLTRIPEKLLGNWTWNGHDARGYSVKGGFLRTVRSDLSVVDVMRNGGATSVQTSRIRALYQCGDPDDNRYLVEVDSETTSEIAMTGSTFRWGEGCGIHGACTWFEKPAPQSVVASNAAKVTYSNAADRKIATFFDKLDGIETELPSACFGLFSLWERDLRSNKTHVVESRDFTLDIWYNVMEMFTGPDIRALTGRIRKVKKAPGKPAYMALVQSSDRSDHDKRNRFPFVLNTGNSTLSLVSIEYVNGMWLLKPVEKRGIKGGLLDGQISETQQWFYAREGLAEQIGSSTPSGVSIVSEEPEATTKRDGTQFRSGPKSDELPERVREAINRAKSPDAILSAEDVHGVCSVFMQWLSEIVLPETERAVTTERWAELNAQFTSFDKTLTSMSERFDPTVSTSWAKRTWGSTGPTPDDYDAAARLKNTLMYIRLARTMALSHGLNRESLAAEAHKMDLPTAPEFR